MATDHQLTPSNINQEYQALKDKFVLIAYYENWDGSICQVWSYSIINVYRKYQGKQLLEEINYRKSGPNYNMAIHNLLDEQGHLLAPAVRRWSKSGILLYQLYANPMPNDHNGVAAQQIYDQYGNIKIRRHYLNNKLHNMHGPAYEKYYTNHRSASNSVKFDSNCQGNCRRSSISTNHRLASSAIADDSNCQSNCRRSSISSGHSATGTNVVGSTNYRLPTSAIADDSNCQSNCKLPEQLQIAIRTGRILDKS